MDAKNNLTLAERILFVDSVVSLSERNGRYEPRCMTTLSELQH